MKLTEALKDPHYISNLCQLILNSPSSKIKQYACVIIRNMILKKEYWDQLEQTEASQIQDVIQKTLMEETKKPVLSVACNVMVLIIQHTQKASLNFTIYSSVDTKLLKVCDKTFNSNEFTGFIEQLERYCFCLQGLLTPVTAKHFVPSNIQDLVQNVNAVFEEIKGLNVQAYMQSAYYIAKCAQSLLPTISRTEGGDKLIDEWGATVLQLLQLYIMKGDEDKALDLIEYFMGMVECDCTSSPAVLVKYTHHILQMVNNTELPELIRKKSVYFLRAMVVKRKSIVINHELFESFIDATVPIFTMEHELDDWYQEEASYKSGLLGSVMDLIDTISHKITPKKFFPNLLKRVHDLLNPPLQNNVEEQPNKQKGAYLIIASVVSGCSNYLKFNEYMDELILCVIENTKPPDPVVQKAVFIALAKLVKTFPVDIKLRPGDILAPIDELLAVLSSILDKLSANFKNGCELGNDDLIEKFIETFHTINIIMSCYDDNEFEDFIDEILSPLIKVLKNPTMPAKLIAYAISAITATASFKLVMQSKFPKITKILEKHLANLSNERLEIRILVIKALNEFNRQFELDYERESGSTFSQFDPFFKKCLRYSRKLLGPSNNPNLRIAIYGLLGGLAENMNVVKLGQSLKIIIPFFTESLSPGKEIMQMEKEKNEQDDALTKIFDLIHGTSSPATSNLTESEINEDYEKLYDIVNSMSNDSIAVANVYMEEKKCALLHLGEIAFNLGSIFAPYVQPMYVLVLPLVNHANLDIQIEAIKCLASFCLCLEETCPISAQTTENQSSIDAFTDTAHHCLDKFGEIVSNHHSKAVATAALDAMEQIMNSSNAFLKLDDIYEGIVSLVKRTITKELKCQQATNDFETDDNQHNEIEPEALIKTGFNFLPTLARVGGLKPNHMDYFLMEITNKLNLDTCKEFYLELMMDIIAEIPTCNFEGKIAIVENFYRIIMNYLRAIPWTLKTNAFNIRLSSMAIRTLRCLLEKAPSFIINESKYPDIKFVIFQTMIKSWSSEEIDKCNKRFHSISCQQEVLMKDCILIVCQLVTTILEHDNIFGMNIINQREEDLTKFVGLILRHNHWGLDIDHKNTLYKCLLTLWTHECRLLTDSDIKLLSNGVLKSITEDDTQEKSVILKLLFVLMDRSDKVNI